MQNVLKHLKSKSIFARFLMSSARKTKTEPPLNKISKVNQLRFETSPNSISSPSKTPPWKPSASGITGAAASSAHKENKESQTPLAFTRQRLNFDDSFDEIESYEKKHAEQLKLSQNHGEFSTPTINNQSHVSSVSCEKQHVKHNLSDDLNSSMANNNQDEISSPDL
jgi:hypothetical protein